MNLIKIFFNGLASTGLMTLYSYWRAHAHDKQFIEPQLLAGLTQTRGKKYSIKKDVAPPRGWIGHLGVGLFFTMIYNKIWKSGKFPGNPFTGFLLGSATSPLAIAAWKLAFKWHRKPPKTDFSHFKKQLIVAHMVFGLAEGLFYRLFHRQTTKKSV